ncbi:MAG: macro domain-containing protein [Anaerolineales bacterium]|nr:macro domain-containing protein [Anaerolineales bacterium]
MFKLILVDPKQELCAAWEEAFADFQSVKVTCGRFETLPHFDCMVSAANSFGLMDGGVDLAITNFFGLELMDRVQAHIIERYRGEQPVGSSFIIPTGHPRHRYLAHTPTMRVPMHIWATDNVYNAMWAMLLAVWQHNSSQSDPIEIVACPGLGTATGGVPPQEAARQMALAYRYFLAPPEQISWPFARNRQSSIGLGGNLGLQKAGLKPKRSE